MNLFKNIFSALIVILFFSSTVLAQMQPQNQMQQLFQEYQQLNRSLQQIQYQALQDTLLADKSDKLSTKIEEEIIKNNPDLKGKIDRRNEIINQFQNVQEGGNQANVQSLQQEFQTLTQELTPYQQKAMQNEELRDMSIELENEMLEKMKEINPQTPEIISRIEEIGRQVQALQQQMTPKKPAQK